MGRPVKPNELKRLTGTLRPDRTRAPLAVLPAAERRPAVPRGMGKLGKAAWRQYWSLGNAWLSPRTDARILERLCRAYDEEALLRERLADEGHTVYSKQTGSTVQNPVAIQLRKLEELITRYEGLCGFTPSDRSRLGMAEVQRVSKLEEFLERRRTGTD